MSFNTSQGEGVLNSKDGEDTILNNEPGLILDAINLLDVERGSPELYSIVNEIYAEEVRLLLLIRGIMGKYIGLPIETTDYC
jgi:hypothetical protein